MKNRLDELKRSLLEMGHDDACNFASPCSCGYDEAWCRLIDGQPNLLRKAINQEQRIATCERLLGNESLAPIAETGRLNEKRWIELRRKFDTHENLITELVHLMHKLIKIFENKV